jgi:1-acyl-sn-glycerol-3-phosphate acyltransferase
MTARSAGRDRAGRDKTTGDKTTGDKTTGDKTGRNSGDATVIRLDGARRPKAPAGKPKRRGADAVAAGAARASGERARRRRSTLLDLDPELLDGARQVGLGPRVVKEPGTAPTDVAPDVDELADAYVAADEDLASAEPDVNEPDVERPDAAVPEGDGPDVSAAASAPPSSTGLPVIAQYAIEAMVEAFVAEAQRAGLTDADERVAQALAWLRRRLTGDYLIDEFGFDVELTEALLPVLRPLYRSWFRVEVRGIENLPISGGALIVANHSGTVALDSLMTMLAVHDEHPAHRHLRLLGADLVFAAPVIGEVGRKVGATVAGSSDAERLLRRGELVGVWPEGFKGIGKPFSERYKLQRFGRGGFVSAALQTQVPIVPCSIVGAEEIYPILGDFTTLARLLGLPYLPMTPTFPWLGPLGLVPLPSKWIIEFGTPIATDGLAGDNGEGSDDPMLIFDLTDQVRETIQQTLYSLLLQRRSVFF